MAELNEVVAEAAEGVAAEAMNVAAVSRALSGRSLTLGLVIGAAIGAGVTYLVTRRKFEKKYEEIAEEEISAMRDHFRARSVAREAKPPLEKLAETAEELGYASPVGPDPEPKPPVPVPPREVKPNKIHHALEEAQDRGGPDPQDLEEWNWDIEKATRDHSVPYVIHFDERGEADFDSLTYTYYEGDDVLCDEANNPLQGREEIVGDHNLDKFGHGSGDPNVVYLRNDNLALEIELTRDPGSFQEEVHGIRHSEGGTQPYPRRRSSSGDED